MSLELMYITNDERIAAIAEKCGVDWIFIDLEIIGKKERQGHLDTVISNHKIEDIAKIKKVLHQSKVLVRINPVYEGSREEIEKVIREGADMIMLPFFKETAEVAAFLKYTRQRIRTCLLLETAEAVKNIDDILKLKGIDCIYIGLNDLRLSYSMSFIFEPLANGTVEQLCNKCRDKGIAYGFGGIAGLRQGELPSEYIIAEHYRLGSSMVILSRSFYNIAKDADAKRADEVFTKSIAEIREFENSLSEKEECYFKQNLSDIKIKVSDIVRNMVQSNDKRKDVVLIANYWHFETENYISRYSTFADLLAKRFNLEVITSTFCHMTKSQRNNEELDLKAYPYKIKLIYENGYQKNISVKRIFSYWKFGRNVLRYMKVRAKPDAIIVSVPTPSVAKKVTAYANKRNIPVIIDIQDLWPEAFRMALDIPVLSNIIFAPMMLQVNRIYAKADKIMAVSDSYVKRALRYNRKDHKGLCIYLGADSQYITEKTKNINVEKPQNEFWIGYVGSLGHSYDLETVLRALQLAKESGIDNIVFQIMGTGILEKRFQMYAAALNIRCNFKGLTEYGLMMETLRMCDIAVNPIVKKSAATIINKVADYAAAGLPVINTQNCEEYRALLEEYQAGINVESEDETAIFQAVKEFYYNQEKLLTMRQNSLRLFEDKFDRQKNYRKLVYLMEDIFAEPVK